ncbi:LuxR C-terminal-related transcriptional regulator [Phytoactinopolyspora halotolerans]|uniref:HTH luxR-type domain-containing protein n=1 Tax=Phytoactinopolyspora halotolerans TaxID=1981512 RepID=A0A6L9S1Q6_9ACTN|nr:LuxR C-terminal-related transcriptional regulator [Phytoactinopolyspora halotolerans]NED98583.1 hypothetical protein [Phytoactinopolyspora halotolerans]
MAAEEAQGSAVFVLSAPPGAGKTMLMTQRCQEFDARGIPVAWLSLDTEDNDPYTLWSGVLAACAAAVGSRQRQVQRALASMRPLGGEVDKGFLRTFYAAIEPLPDGLLLVLDDLHEVVSHSALAGLGRLLKTLPRGLRVMLGCRRDPALPIPRMILDGSATEIRAADLAFADDEARELLQGHGIQLADDDLAMLLERTEGWAAGLRLATLSLAQREDKRGYIATFAGEDRPVSDYLVSEVLAQQPADIEAFLLDTAVAEWLLPELAGALSGRPDAGAVLRRLTRDNILVTGQDVAARSYRYHALLRSYLLAELDRRDVTARPRLHRVAADWFAHHDMPSMALDHAVDAEDWDLVAELLDREGLRLLMAGEGASLTSKLDMLPAEVLARPVVGLLAVICAAQSGDLARAGDHFDTVGRDPYRHADARLRRLHMAAVLCEARLRGVRTPAVMDALNTISAPMDGVRDRPLELFALANSGMLRTSMGDVDRAEADLSAALGLARELGCDFLALDCLAHLAGSAASRQDFGTASAWSAEALKLAADRGWRSSSRMLPAYLVAAWAAWQMHDMAAAAEYLALAAAIDADVEPEVVFATRLLRAFVEFVESQDRRAVLTRLRSMWADAEPTWLAPFAVCSYCLTEVQMALAIADSGWAAQAAARARRLVGKRGDVLVMDALIHAHNGAEGPARQALASVLAGEAPCQVRSSEIAAWLLEAQIADGSGQPARAYEALRRSIDLAAPGRAIRDVASASDRVRALLIHNLGRFGGHDGFVAEVLDVTHRAVGGADATGGAARDTLTARELELLRDLPSMLTLEEIASARVVSVNTVKSHLRALYRKLGVNSRREAVECGRGLGLL